VEGGQEREEAEAALKTCGDALVEGRSSSRATMGNRGEREWVAEVAQAYWLRCLQRWKEDQVEEAGAYIRVDPPLTRWKGGTCHKQLREFHDSHGFLFQTPDGKEFHDISSSDTSSALSALDTDPAAEWRTELLTLHEKDIHGVSETSPPDHPDPKRARAILGRTLLNGGVLPEGNRAVSWIWRGAPTSDDSVGGYNECLFVLLCGHLVSEHCLQHTNSNGQSPMPGANVGRKKSNS